MIKHVICMKFSDFKPAADIAQELRDLVKVIPEIRSMEVGLDVLHTPNRSYDLALIATFDNLSDLEIYNDHPDHVKVKEHILKYRTAYCAVDFEY